MHGDECDYTALVLVFGCPPGLFRVGVNMAFPMFMQLIGLVFLWSFTKGSSIALVDVGFKDFSIIGIHASYDYTWSRFTYSDLLWVEALSPIRTRFVLKTLLTSNIGVNVQRRRVLSHLF